MTVNGVVVLPETDDLTICVQYRGIITKDNYRSTLTPLIEDRIAKKGAFRILVEYRDFRGWEIDAADDNMSDISHYGRYAEKFAYIDPPEHKILMMKFMDPVLGGKIRFFAGGQYGEAVRWIKE